jgi:hypothetical protein
LEEDINILVVSFLKNQLRNSIANLYLEINTRVVKQDKPNINKMKFELDYEMLKLKRPKDKSMGDMWTQVHFRMNSRKAMLFFYI